MSSFDEKKRSERGVLEHLRQLLPSFPEGEVIPDEEPDFIVVLASGKKIGIEITQLHREVRHGEMPLQAQEALKRRAVENAKEIYDSAGNPFVHASIHFANVQLSKFDVSPFAQRIAKFVASLIPPPGEVRTAEPGFEDESDFPEELSYVSVYSLPDAEGSFFSSPGSTWLATLQDEDVKRALLSKNAKHKRYRSKADEIWLVISCNGGFMSTWFEGTEVFQDKVFETDFARVFILSHFGNKVIELRRQAAAGANR